LPAAQKIINGNVKMRTLKKMKKNHRQFQEFLKSLASDYNDGTFYAEVRWLNPA
jgi:hypothetical protein